MTQRTCCDSDTTSSVHAWGCVHYSPTPLRDLLPKFGKAVLSAGADALAEGSLWRQWAIRKINRIDMQDASTEELQKALESMMK